MAEIRLSKLTRQFNIGLSTLVEFLQSKGADVENNPNAKVSDEFLPALETKFGDEKKLKQDSEKVSIKLKEIIELGSKKKSVDNDEEDHVQEIIIKSTGISALTEKPAERPVEKTVEKQVEKPAEKPAEKPVDRPEEKTPAEPAREPEAREVTPPEEKPAPKVVEPAPKTEDIKAETRVTAAESAQTPAERTAGTDAGRPATVSMEEHKSPENRAPHQDVKKDGQEGDGHPEGPKQANITVEKLSGPVVVDKIDLSKFDRPKKGKKRERIQKPGSQKVDVTKVQVDNDSSRKDKPKPAGGNNGNNGGNRGNGRDDRKNRRSSGNNKGGDRFKPAMTEAETEEMQKEIQKQIKETYAKMNESQGKHNFGAEHRKDKRHEAARRMHEEMEQMEAEKNILKVTEFVTVNDLATMMDNTPVTKVIAACMNLGLMVSINQRLDAEALVLVAEEFGYEIEFVTAEISEAIKSEADDEKDLQPRPPVVTVMGHVDHGKTSLLDNIRNTNVIAGEAGGITQHIGAYNVILDSGQRITFLDTPGHEAFTAMRARGAKMTDIAIIIIAADDAIMPQTVEAINHAQAAGVPMIFAINKIDKPGANPEKIREQLANMNILVEDWGGKYQCQEISAKKGINVDKLLEKVLLEAELLELKANPNRPATGAVIESSLDKGRGYLATVLVQNGTMRVGDVMLSGSHTGRIKAMYNERGQKVTEAGPSTPVSVLGLNGAPTAGETFNIMEDEREARDIAMKREQLLRIQGIKTQKHMTLEEIGRRIAIGNFKTLNIIVKGDVDGSVEALSDSLLKLGTEEVAVNVIHKAVGAISESDVLLAAASDAIIIGFQVRPSQGARKLAEKEAIEIRIYSVIYDAINEVKSGIEGMLEPEEKEEILGLAEVRETFKISKVGTIAGCMVVEGKISRSAKVRVIRDGIVVYSGDIGSLKRFKDDAKEVLSGMDCGIGIANFNDVKPGDTIESYNIISVKRTL